MKIANTLSATISAIQFYDIVISVINNIVVDDVKFFMCNSINNVVTIIIMIVVLVPLLEVSHITGTCITCLALMLI